MELYGSLLNISGSVTASAFTGSFIGDGSGLTGIQASGVTGLNLSQISNGDATASISPTGFNVNKNTQIQGNLSVTGAIIANEYIVSSSVIYMTTSFASGSSAFGNDNNDVHQFTGSVNITGSISLNGQAIGTGKLDETTFQSYTSSNNSRVSLLETSSGSLNSFTSSINTTIKSKLDSDNVISGSVQVNITGTTGYSTFSSSISNSIDSLSSSVATTTSGITSTITSLSSSLTSSIGSLSSSIATTDLNQDGRLNALETSSGSLNTFTSSINTTIKSKLNDDGVLSSSLQILNGSNLVSSSTQVTAYGFATTGSNLFKGTQTHSGSIIPSVDNEYDLGSATHQWRDVYISSGSLYIDGTKVISSTAQELQITTDNGQSIKILEGGTDSIILQTADGNVELKSNADGDILLDPTNGKIMLKGPVEILTGQKIQSSVGGTPIVFANDIVVSGSIDITGTIEGINLTDFSSSVNTRLGNLETSGGSLNSFTSSTNSRLSSIETSTGSLNTFTSSINTTIKSKLDSDGIISGSSQITLSGTTGFSTVSASLSSLSSSISITNFNQDGRLNSIEGKTGSYATTGSNNFNGNQTITGSLVITQNLQVLGSSSIVYTTASQLIVEDNKIVLNASFPAERFSGIEVHDSGSNGSVTASLFWDGLNNRWIYQNSSEAHYGGAMFIAGPRNTGSLGDEPLLTSGKLPKSIGGDHIGDSIITETNGGIGISGSLVITGSILSTVTPLVSGSSQITYSGLTGIPSGIISGSEQVKSLLPTGTVSGSSQVLDGSGIWSGSAQLPSGVVSGSVQVSFSGITDKPTLVSGSSQITFGSISSIPGGLVSGSAQIDLTGTTNYSTGIKTRLNAEGVVSGSAQITYGNISSIPSGIVSGSSQITLSSTTGYGSVLNQAVLTTSSPTFGGITLTGALGGTSATFSSNVTINGTVIGTDQTFGGAYRTFAFGTNSNGFNRIFAANDTSDGLYLNAATGRGIYFRVNGGGTDVVSISSAGAVTLTGTISASNFSGTSSGTNTGDQTSVTGNAGTVTNGVYTTGDQSIGGTKTFTGDIVINGSTFKLKGSGGSAEFIWYRDYSGSPSEPGFNINNRAGVTTFSHNANGGGTSVSGNFSANNFSGSSSGTNTGDQTLSGLGGLSNNTDSEQTIGGGAYYFNSGAGRMNADPRWNESGYDADLGCLHLWSWTAAGVAYGRAGIAFYNDNAYQYLTTKSNTTGLFVNNSLIATAGSSPTFASVTGTITSSGSGDSNAPFRFSADYSGWMSIVAGAPGSNNGWGLFWAGNASAQYGTNGAGGPGNIWSNADNPNEYVFVGNGGSRMSIYGNNGNVWMGGDVRMDGSVGVGVSPALKFHVRGSNEMVRFENTSTTSGQYSQLNIRAGNRNGYIWLANENTSSWAGAGGMNIYTENGNIDFWSNAVQRVRIQTDGHMVPYVNNTYDLGSASLGWRNVYTNDLHLSNMNKPEGNDIDGTNGNWTIQEGAENLFIINNNNGKKFKIKLEEI
jgi:hypothetical protein